MFDINKESLLELNNELQSSHNPLNTRLLSEILILNFLSKVSIND